mmetsp:Transcript_81017/g.230024  ORF Transcript_81017/g.230024 Transcript_81017/m.230024 type:complete len:327 (-) Transcript_81017:31-1011(-)
MVEFGESPVVEFWTGAATALIDCCIFHSIDTLKVRSQNAQDSLPWDAFRKASMLSRPSLVLGSLYAGFSTNLFLKIPYMSMMFGMHAVNKCIFDMVGLEHANEDVREITSAVLVGVEASLILSPLELVRIQGQNNGKGGLISATRYVATHHSPWVLLRGMDACIHREVKYCIGQFAAIGFVESALKRWSEANHETNSLALQLHENASLRILASSMSVGFMCTVISQPDDVVKTRMQSHLPPSRASSSSAAKGAASGAASDSAAERVYQKYRGYLASFRTVSAEEGVAALWRGWVWRCCVRVPLGLAVINMAHPHVRPHVAALLPNS